MAETTSVQWQDVRDWGVEGQGWSDTLCPYDRLPARAQPLVPPAVWELSRSAIGMCATFETDAPAIHARWQLRSAQLGEANFAVAGFSGLDLYGDDAGAWRWVGTGHQVKDQQPELCIVDWLEPRLRRYRVYLPLRNPVEKLEIGVPAGARFTPVPPRREKPIVFYGTSIVHGAYATHAGIVHPALLGRRLDRPSINLGFSGNARMEPALAELLAELDAAAYVIDPLPNMDLALVRERAEAFTRLLCKARPGVPVVLVEDRPLNNYWARPTIKAMHQEKWREYRSIYQKLRGEGFVQLSYVEGETLFGADGEASMDTSHPSDLGFVRMADALEPVLRAVLA